MRRFGYGFGEAAWKFDQYTNRVWALAGWPAPNTHSGYLEALLDVGFVGFAFLAVFLAQLGTWSLKSFNREHSLHALIFFALLVSILVSNLAEVQPGTYDTYSWTLLVIAFCILLREEIDQKASAPAVASGD